MQDIKRYQIIDETNLGACHIESGLCIIVADFRSNPQKIKDMVLSNTDTDFWLAVKSLTREEILFANSIGIKNVISYPVDEKLIDAYIEVQKLTSSGQELSQDMLVPLTDVRVMIVDDNVMNIQLLEEVLGGLGISLEVYTQPQNVFDRISEEKFDLFLLDILMPDISGFEIAEFIKGTEKNKETPIIFISALSDYEFKISGYGAGACQYIEKPYDVGIVRQQIYNILKQASSNKAQKKSREDFLAMITHDLKTPISAEISALQLLLKNKLGELNSSQQEIIGDILSSAKFLKTMTDNILCSYKQENSDMCLKRERVDLVNVINQCLDETRYMLVDKELKSEFYLDVRDAFVFVDVIEIKRVINNLIANAVDYSPVRGEIVIKLFKRGIEYFFSVSDSGDGIKLENPNDIFENNFTLAKETKRIGFGLGLAISKNIIDAHGGRIFAESTINRGTTITFTIPE